MYKCILIPLQCKFYLKHLINAKYVLYALCNWYLKFWTYSQTCNIQRPSFHRHLKAYPSLLYSPRLF